MADNPTGGAGGFAGGAAKDQAAAAVGKVPPKAGPPAQQTKAGHDNGAALAPLQREGVGKAAQDVPDKGGQQDAGPALGAGGTSLAAQEPGFGNETGGGDGKGLSGAKMAGAAAAVPAAGVVGQVMLLAMFVNWLKGMAMAALALASNLANLLIGVALAVGKAVVGAVMGVGGAVAGAVGGAVSAAAAGVTTVVTGIVIGTLVTVGTVVGVNTSNELSRRDGSIDCRPMATAALAKVEGSDENVEGKTLENAKLVFGVLSAWGMGDENIAGILGNWDAESGIDPTGVETIYDEPFALGSKKKDAESKGFDVDLIAPAYGARFPGVDLIGIGLGQWSNGRNTQLTDYARGAGKSWATLETQLGFMISKDSGAPVIKHMISTPIGTPVEAAMYFHDEWERSADTPALAARRGEKATKWMGMFSGWEKNAALADSILAQSGTTVTDANTSRAQAVRSDCLGAPSATLTMAEGGLTLEQAQEVMDLYKVEGEQFLRSRFGAGGPGDCGFGKADNCVGFSTYFANKYTSFHKYAPGNGVQTAHSMADMMGKTVSRTPTPYSVASGPGIGPEGHTFVVLGIQGDNAVVGEASCGSNHTGSIVKLVPLSKLTDGVWQFVDVSDLMSEQSAEL